MRLLRRSGIAESYGVLPAIALLIVFAANGAAQQSESILLEGKALDSIRIGESDETDVIAAYGKEFKLINHREYSYEMSYQKLGVSFYYCKADPKKEIFVVRIEEPARVMTNLGIRLGESTMEDVFRLYGKPENTSDDYKYDGVYFGTARDSSDEAEEIVEPTKEEAEANKAESDGVLRSLGADASNFSILRISQLTYFDPIDIEKDGGEEIRSTDDEPQEEEVDERKAMDSVKTEVVKRIKLVEEGGLRQCDTKFKPN